MIVMNKKEFAKTPNGTVYCLYKPCVLERSLKVKTGYYKDSQGMDNFDGIINLFPSLDYDECEQNYFPTNNFSIDEALCDYEEDQLFAIFNKEEVRRMIDVLTYALCNCEGKCFTDFDCMGGC